MNKNSLYLTLKLAALAAVVSEFISANTLDGLKTVGVLAFCCLFTADFLINRLCRVKQVRLICAPLGLAACVICGAETYFPLLAILIFQFTDQLEVKGYFYGIYASATVLSALIFSPDQNALVMAAILTAVGVFARIAVERVEYFRELSENQRKIIAAQTERANKLQAYLRTVRESVALEERSRFSTRIHDKLGHGISGSIILLEGAKLNFRKNPDQSEKTLETAIENLRGSVDEIRATLREERPKRSSASAAELKEMMDRFAVDHKIKTELSVEGDAERIPPPVWNCVKDNLTETLTNVVKHSNADEFALKIHVYDKIIRAEFTDNGRNSGGFSKGMGLDGIEDRTTAAGGKCLFQCGITGFKIINIFGVNNDQGTDS